MTTNGKNILGGDALQVGGAQAIRRAAEVLRTVGQLQMIGAKLSRIAVATGLSTPTTYRMLRSLTDERLLTFDSQSRRYFLGPLAFELGLAVRSEAQFHRKWYESVREVANRTRLTSYLIARSHNDVVCFYSAQGFTPIRAMPMEIGQRVPLGIGAGSLAILSSLEDGEIDVILDANQPRFAFFPGGPQATDEILGRIAETRLRGYSTSNGTVAAGVSGIGVLLPPRSGGARAALTVSAVADQFDISEAKRLVFSIQQVIAEVAT